eukprot:1472526-Lingulodinium_polyedra.AAC.1
MGGTWRESSGRRTPSTRSGRRSSMANSPSGRRTPSTRRRSRRGGAPSTMVGSWPVWHGQT